MSVAPRHRGTQDYIRAAYIPFTANHNAPEHRLKPQIVGSCFGCQVICEALGGLVSRRLCINASGGAHRRPLSRHQRPPPLSIPLLQVTRNPRGRYCVKAEEIFIQVRS